MFSTSGVFSTLGDIMSTLGDVQYIGVDIMMHVGEQGDKSLSIYIENPNVLMISLTCIMISPNVLMISPQCTHDTPNVLMISPNVLMKSPDVLMKSPNVLTHYTGCLCLMGFVLYLINS